MMSRLMLNLHRTATERSRNYSTSTSDFGSVLSTNMLFTSRFDNTGLQANTALVQSDTEWSYSHPSSSGRGESSGVTSDEYEMRYMRTL